jgi:hypothetical protein
MGIEVAIGAFAHTPGQMDIEPQRRQQWHLSHLSFLVPQPSNPVFTLSTLTALQHCAQGVAYGPFVINHSHEDKNV